MGLLGTIGGIIGGNKAKRAAEEQARTLTAAGQTAFDASRFRPVGVTTAFGTSNYTVDPTTGALTGAGYQLTPEMQAIQGGLLSQAGGGSYSTLGISIPDHTHAVTVNSAGSSGTNANLQPYITVAMWKRTA